MVHALSMSFPTHPFALYIPASHDPFVHSDYRYWSLSIRFVFKEGVYNVCLFLLCVCLSCSVSPAGALCLGQDDGACLGVPLAVLDTSEAELRALALACGATVSVLTRVRRLRAPLSALSPFRVLVGCQQTFRRSCISNNNKTLLCFAPFPPLSADVVWWRRFQVRCADGPPYVSLDTDATATRAAAAAARDLAAGHPDDPLAAAREAAASEDLQRRRDAARAAKDWVLADKVLGVRRARACDGV
jgi:hypothetical protein